MGQFIIELENNLRKACSKYAWAYTYLDKSSDEFRQVGEALKDAEYAYFQATVKLVDNQ